MANSKRHFRRKDTSMLWFMIIAAVLIGLAYADYCLVDNTEHFGMSLGRAAEGGQEGFSRLERLEPEVSEAETEIREREPAWILETVTEARGAEAEPAWLLLELGPILELREEAS
jgi:hypothetical protein